MLFNNNSGGDAADNGLEMLEMLNISYTGLAPKRSTYSARKEVSRHMSYLILIILGFIAGTVGA